MTNILSTLMLVDSEQIIVHERFEPKRLRRTVQSIRKDGVVKNSIMAIQMDGQYFVIDGTHRVNALKQLGCRRVPVQVVDQNQYKLEFWSHLVLYGEWIERLRNHPELIWKTDCEMGQPIASLVDNLGKTHYLFHREKSSVLDYLDAWHEIVSSYSETQDVIRLAESEGSVPEKGYVLLRFPKYDFKQIRDIVNQGKIIPAGITRFIVDGRLLNLNIPLQLLISKKVDEKEWENLRTYWSHHLRYYSESVYLCEA